MEITEGVGQEEEEEKEGVPKPDQAGHDPHRSLKTSLTTSLANYSEKMSGRTYNM